MSGTKPAQKTKWMPELGFRLDLGSKNWHKNSVRAKSGRAPGTISSITVFTVLADKTHGLNIVMFIPNRL